MKATFFVTYIMVDGWTGVVVRFVPFVIYRAKNSLLVKTDQDRGQAMDPGFLDFATYEPRIQLYFLIGLVYCVITPILLPLLTWFSVTRSLIFMTGNTSAAAFWPDVHRQILIGLFISHILLLGLLSAKSLKRSTPLLIALPVLTIFFYYFCKGRFESAFVRFPLPDAMRKDTLERGTEPTLNLRAYLRDAYLQPVFKGGEMNPLYNIVDEEEDGSTHSNKEGFREE